MNFSTQVLVETVTSEPTFHAPVVSLFRLLSREDEQATALRELCRNKILHRPENFNELQNSLLASTFDAIDWRCAVSELRQILGLRARTPERVSAGFSRSASTESSATTRTVNGIIHL